jgi:hypothetical protein
MIPFQLYGRPLSEPMQDSARCSLPCWPSNVQPPSLNVDYQTATARLCELPKCHFELDGSFGWTSAGQRKNYGSCWELYGTIFDDGERIVYVELRGTCDAKEWLQLLEIFAPSTQRAAALLLSPSRILVAAEDLPILWSSASDPISK